MDLVGGGSGLIFFPYSHKNYALTVRHELSKFSDAYAISDKSDKTVVSTLLFYFQHFGTILRMHFERMCKHVKDINNRISHYYRITRERTESQKQKVKTRFDEQVSDSHPNYEIGDSLCQRITNERQIRK